MATEAFREGVVGNPATDLPPLHRIMDRGPSRVPVPSYEETFATGVAVARAKLRRIPADLEIVDTTRLSDYEPSSLKRLAAMTAWAEEYPGVTLQDGELLLLNGTTVGRLVTYMQLKRTNVEIMNDKELKGTTQEEVELTKEELDVLNSRVPKVIYKALCHWKLSQDP